MVKLVKRRKIIPIPWACPVFPVANFTLDLVGINTKNREIIFLLQHWLLNIYETTLLILHKFLRKKRPLVRPEASGYKHPKVIIMLQVK